MYCAFSIFEFNFSFFLKKYLVILPFFECQIEAFKMFLKIQEKYPMFLNISKCSFNNNLNFFNSIQLDLNWTNEERVAILSSHWSLAAILETLFILFSTKVFWYCHYSGNLDPNSTTLTIAPSQSHNNASTKIIEYFILEY